MAKKNLSIYITGEVIRITEGKVTGGSIAVMNVISLPTPAGSVDDGLITDVAKVAGAITEAVGSKYMSNAKVYFTVYSRKIAAKEVEIPYTKKTDVVGAMIESNIDDYFPMGNMDDYVTRFTILDTVEKEGRKSYQVSVYAVLKELIASYYELAKTLKMPLAGIDYQVNSLHNLVKRQNRAATALILQIDDDATHISVFRGPSQLFRRSVPYGVDSLAQAVAASKDLSEEEARHILLNERKEEAEKHFSVAALRHRQSVAWIDSYMTADEYQDMIHDFTSSITRVINFFVSKNSDVVIEKAKVIGNGVKIAHLGQSLETILGMPVELVKHLTGVHVRRAKDAAHFHDDDLANYLPNIGALIKPLDFRIEEEVRFTKGGIGYGLIIFLIFIAIAGVGGTVGFVWWQQAELDAERNNLRRSIDSIRHGEEVYNNYVRTGDYYALVEQFNQSTRDENEALYALILLLEEIMPEGIGIAQMQSNGGKIDMTATSAYGKLGVAGLLTELKEIPWIKDVWVGNIRDSYDDFGTVYSTFPVSFEISNDIRESQLAFEALAEALANGETEGGADE